MPVCDLAARQVPRTVCNPVLKTTCNAVTGVVIDNVCNARSVQEYVSVPMQIVVVTPVEECPQVDREVCTRAAEKVARQVCEEVAVAVAPVTVEHHVAPARVVVEARAPAVAVVAHHGHGLTKVELTLYGASRHGAGVNHEHGDAHSFVSGSVREPKLPARLTAPRPGSGQRTQATAGIKGTQPGSGGVRREKLNGADCRLKDH